MHGAAGDGVLQAAGPSRAGGVGGVDGGPEDGLVGDGGVGEVAGGGDEDVLDVGRVGVLEVGDDEVKLAFLEGLVVEWVSACLGRKCLGAYGSTSSASRGCWRWSSPAPRGRPAACSCASVSLLPRLDRPPTHLTKPCPLTTPVSGPAPFSTNSFCAAAMASGWYKLSPVTSPSAISYAKIATV